MCGRPTGSSGERLATVDQRQHGVELGQVGDGQIGAERLQLVQRMAAGGHRHDPGPGGAGAGDVERRVADDHGVRSIGQRHATARRGRDRGAGQLVALGMVVAERPPGEAVPQVEVGQLDARARLRSCR